MVKYIHPQRSKIDLNPSSQRSNVPIIHTNVSTYAQVLMNFHESNPVPENIHTRDLHYSSMRNLFPLNETPLQKFLKQSTIKVKSNQQPSMQNNQSPFSKRDSTLLKHHPA